MKKPNFTLQERGGILTTNDDLTDRLFNEYRKTNEFKRCVLCVNLTCFIIEKGIVTNKKIWIKSNYYQIANAEVKKDFDILVAYWNSFYGGKVYKYSYEFENEKKILDFQI